MDARTKAVKTHRKRLRTRGLKRVEVTVRAENVALLRDLAARLRTSTEESKRIKATLSPVSNRKRSLAEALYDPVLAGREFDDVFEELERSRHDPDYPILAAPVFPDTISGNGCPDQSSQKTPQAAAQ